MLLPVSKATDTRERILDAAEHLVLRHGFAATTVDAVIGATGVSKGAFFHHFRSKADLGRALVARYAAADAETLEVALAAAESVTDDPAAQLVAVLRQFEQAADTVLETQPSCLFVSFIYETELADRATADLVAGAVRHWRARLLEKLRQAAAIRQPPPAVDLPSLADQVFTVFEGAFLLARALDEPRSLRHQLAHLRHYLELLFGLPVTGDDPAPAAAATTRPAG